MSELPKRLDGWKAIAEHLARDERTVQRWAKTRGLPVHHLPGKGASVFAVRAELDEWLIRGPQLPTPLQGETASAGEQPAVPQLPSPVARAAPQGSRGARILTVTAGISAVVLGLLAANVPNRWSGSLVPDAVDVVRNELVGRARGRVLWRYTLERPEDAPPDSTWRSSPTPARPIDLDGDEVLEIPVLLTLARNDDRFIRNEFLLLSADGDLLWRYVPEALLRFGTTTFDGPWRIDNWIATDSPSGPLIWLSVIHHVWWPSFVVAVDAEGQATTRLVHPGHIYTLTEIKNDTGSYVVAAGINNEYATAMMAVLDMEGPIVEPPSSDSRYTCQGGPHEKPLRYLLFPRSELNSLLGQPYNRVYEVAAVNNRLELFVQEASDPHLRAVYRLSRNFVLEGVRLADAYWETHRAQERIGALDHAADVCPTRRDGMKIRVWEAQRGWTEQMVAVSGGL